MPLTNPTDWPIVAASTSGSDLADRLNRLFDAWQSNQSNATRPLSLKVGGIWTRLEQSGDLTLMFFDGVVDHPIGTVSGGQGSFGSGGALALVWDMTRTYKKGNVIYDKPTKTYMLAKHLVAAGSPFNLGDWETLNDVFNQIHQGTGGGVHVGTTPPDDPVEGSLWYDSTDPAAPVLKIYYLGAWDTKGVGGSPGGLAIEAEYLVVAGGGGGGSNSFEAEGGGGAGGYLEGTTTLLPGETYTIVVGSGGGANSPGGNSVFSAFTAIGGGAGAPALPSRNMSGGSGGGHSARDNSAENSPAGSGTAGQGHNGSSTGSGGGGGGAGAPGSGRQGGDGKESSITGSPVWYAGGGGGADRDSGAQPQWHGRGQGVNTGGGGQARSGADSGVVVIRYKSKNQLATGGTITTFINGLDKWWIHKFDTSGDLVTN